jgi:hypothetical protein
MAMDVLKARLANTLEYARNVLDKFTIPDLETILLAVFTMT